MYCPNCGTADQKAKTYCRRCGEYLPDYHKSLKKPISPQEHITANLVLSIMTAITSLTLAIVLYSIFLGREETPVIIYVVAGFLIAMGAWQAQTVWRTWQLRKHFKRRDGETETAETIPEFESPKTRELLNEPDLSDVVPSSVTESTTRKLKVNRK